MLGTDPHNTLGKPLARLARFTKQCAALGCLSGFRHFEVCMYSQEELLFSIIPAGLGRDRKLDETFPSTHLLDEAYIKEHDRMVFLITGYPIYSCPYIYPKWMSRQDHGLHVDGSSDKKPVPLRLTSTMDWRINDVALWEMIWELISLVSWPSSQNPFAIDFDYLDRLPLPKMLFLTGGLIGYLQSLWIEAKPKAVPFVDKVYQDLQQLQQRHLTAMRDYAQQCHTPATTY
ncbi:hypothetical protein DM01DRAFT_329223 [Hesseltinella vesiculosa]|uniref:DUF7886 domain-containing protein n=1 Tax=Hesseltinella vesiculosa TaxID=101127 RepID=A0A1X2GN03_9FUNG|nr:hypothetical protein DM01DRAFT_329223 [Hesseltinella vesiculosa]